VIGVVGDAFRLAGLSGITQTAGAVRTMRFEFSGPLSSKRLALPIQAL
jgi:hypothetical protein